MKANKRTYEMALAALEELMQDSAMDEADLFTYPLEEAERTPLRAERTPLIEERTRPEVGRAPLSQMLDEFGELPQGALFLGAAYDGLPILLNLNDATPGPVLIAGDSGSGKTGFLRMVGQSVEQIHSPKDVQFGVITNKPREWEGFAENKNCMGIFPSYERSADDFVRSLADWAHNNHRAKRFALLLIDDLEAVLKMDDDAQQDLRWLLLRGPNRRVWPLVSLDVARRAPVLPWLDAFRTRLFGSVKNIRSAEAMLPMRGADLHLLEPGAEFVLYENPGWVRFWVPRVG